MFQLGEGSHILSLIATLLLVAGLVSDLRTRKYPNSLFLGSLAIAIISSLVVAGVQGTLTGALGFFLAIGLFLPLVLTKAVGAGDMKMLAAAGVLIGPQAVISTAIFGLAWAVIFGIVKIIISGEGRKFLENMSAILQLKPREGLTLHSMPLTVGLLLGWLSTLAIGSGGLL
jgi:prepilin peptidase CpaA